MTQKSLFIRLLSPLSSSCILFLSLLSVPHHPFSPFLLYNFPAFFSLQKRYISANDLIRVAIWSSITVDFIVMAVMWGVMDGWMNAMCQCKFIFFHLASFCFLIVIIISYTVAIQNAFALNRIKIRKQSPNYWNTHQMIDSKEKCW